MDSRTMDYDELIFDSDIFLNELRNDSRCLPSEFDTVGKNLETRDTMQCLLGELDSSILDEMDYWLPTPSWQNQWPYKWNDIDQSKYIQETQMEEKYRNEISQPIPEFGLPGTEPSDLEFMLMNPRNFQLSFPDSVSNGEAKKQPLLEQNPAYHWRMDHNYSSLIPRDSQNTPQEAVCDVQCYSSDDQCETPEPIIDVWAIEDFEDKEVQDVNERAHRQCSLFKQQGKRTSTRMADLERRKASRKLNIAVSAALISKTANHTRKRQYIRPKNSVETTPSQSDIEECFNPPTRVTIPRVTNAKTVNARSSNTRAINTKVPNTRVGSAQISNSKVTNARTLNTRGRNNRTPSTRVTNGRTVNARSSKKKTTKGRTDHSESERQRREVLRVCFAELSDLIPLHYMVGEKPSSQISKQKILNGAKGFLNAIMTSKTLYKTSVRGKRRLNVEAHKVLKRAALYFS